MTMTRAERLAFLEELKKENENQQQELDTIRAKA
tara:strand:- start:308 stop:409 length:102 start_codon:yes stop_codon:yes gene_type:complete